MSPLLCVSGGAGASSAQSQASAREAERGERRPPAAAPARGSAAPAVRRPPGPRRRVRPRPAPLPRSAPAELCALPGRRRGQQRGPRPGLGFPRTCPPRVRGRERRRGLPGGRGSGQRRTRPRSRAARRRRARGADPAAIPVLAAGRATPARPRPLGSARGPGPGPRAGDDKSAAGSPGSGEGGNSVPSVTGIQSRTFVQGPSLLDTQGNLGSWRLNYLTKVSLGRAAPEPQCVRSFISQMFIEYHREPSARLRRYSLTPDSDQPNDDIQVCELQI